MASPRVACCPALYFLSALVSRPPWCSTKYVTWPFSFLKNSISVSTTFGKTISSESAKIGTLVGS